MVRTAYVAGKISGLRKEDVNEKFNVVTKQLVDRGYNVINPLVGTDYSKSWDDAMRSEIKKMLECDEVHLLPDWQESRGAQLERDIALRLGIEIIYH